MILNIGGGGGVKPRIVVTAPTGSDVTVSKGSTILYAPEVSGTWTFNVPEQGDWSATAILGSKTASKTVSVSKVGVYNVTLRYVSTTLNDNSWEDIKGVADASEGQNYWAVGDTKQITINGKLSDGLTLSSYSTYVYIIGFNHNSSVEGTGIAFGGFKTAQTSGTDVALCDSGYNSFKNSGQWFNMNNSATNTGGWKNSRMRYTTLPLVKSALPSDLQAVIKTTTIYSDNTGGDSDTASYVTATQDELYLLAEFEIFGARSYANSAERNHQQQYAYYVAGNSKIKYRHDSTATAVIWWERSVYATDARPFCIVATNGAAFYANADYSFGLAVAFKVGSNSSPESRCYLYNEGDECEDVTGGWVSTPIQSATGRWDFGNITKTKNTDSFQIVAGGPGGAGSFYTANKIPINGYSKLMGSVDFTGSGNVESIILWLQLWEVTPAGHTYRTSRELLYTPTELSGSIALELPISDGVGEFYALIGTGNNSSTSWNCDAKFRKIWLE